MEMEDAALTDYEWIDLVESNKAFDTLQAPRALKRERVMLILSDGIQIYFKNDFERVIEAWKND